MKKSTLALVVMGIVASASVQAAEIYNKDGNKLDSPFLRHWYKNSNPPLCCLMFNV